jgi:hypothetical protein
VVLEVLTTVRDYRGRGAGNMLFKWGCGQADKSGEEVFVETNHGAGPFYQKFRFKLKVEADMPGDFRYIEVRSRAANTGMRVPLSCKTAFWLLRYWRKRKASYLSHGESSWPYLGDLCY